MGGVTVYRFGCLSAVHDRVRENLGLVAAAIVALFLAQFVLLVALCATASGTVCSDLDRQYGEQDILRITEG